jgi:hypothetical protein
MRNRVRADGSEWLTTRMKNFFQGKLFETNEEYSDDKKAYIDALMAIEYNNSENDCNKKEIAAILEKHLNSQGIFSVAIFGKDRFCEWLVEILAFSDIRVKFTVNQELLEDTVEFPHSLKNKLRRFLKYWIKRITHRSKEPVSLYIFDRWPKVDAIIVAPYAKYNFFREKIKDKTKARIVSIVQLIT